MEQNPTSEADQGPKLDLGFKEGQTIKVNLNIGVSPLFLSFARALLVCKVLNTNRYLEKSYHCKAPTESQRHWPRCSVASAPRQFEVASKQRFSGQQHFAAFEFPSAVAERSRVFVLVPRR